MNKFEFQEIVKNAKSKADICRALNLAPKGGNYAIVNRLLKEYDIVWDKPYTPWNKGKRYRYIKYNLKDILVENSPYKNTNCLKRRLIKTGLKEAKCELCGYSESIELHHVNGNPTDNRIENLQILCPNCHSKTTNYRSKNIKGRIIQNPKDLLISEEEAEIRELEKKAKKQNKTVEKYLESKEHKIKKSLLKKVCPSCGKEFQPRDSTQKYCSVECYREDVKGARPTLLQLIKDFSELGSFIQIGNKYGVSDNAVRKWCKLYNIPFHSKELKEYTKNFNNPDYIVPECKKIEKKVLDHDKIISDYLSGLSTSEVAKLNNCDSTSVRTILNRNNIERRSKSGKIEQYDLNNNLIATFNSIKDACNWIIENNLAKNKETISGFIGRCCRKKCKSAYGYIWKKLII